MAATKGLDSFRRGRRCDIFSRIQFESADAPRAACRNWISFSVETWATSDLAPSR